MRTRSHHRQQLLAIHGACAVDGGVAVNRVDHELHFGAWRDPLAFARSDLQVKPYRQHCTTASNISLRTAKVLPARRNIEFRVLEQLITQTSDRQTKLIKSIDRRACRM